MSSLFRRMSKFSPVSTSRRHRISEMLNSAERRDFEVGANDLAAVNQPQWLNQALSR